MIGENRDSTLQIKCARNVVSCANLFAQSSLKLLARLHLLTFIIFTYKIYRRQVSGFALTLHDWQKNLAPLFDPVRSKTKPTRDSLAHEFSRFHALCGDYTFRSTFGSLTRFIYCIRRKVKLSKEKLYLYKVAHSALRLVSIGVLYLKITS